jgi:hypothetical protein
MKKVFRLSFISVNMRPAVDWQVLDLKELLAIETLIITN